jgi:hypothetical protein
VLLNGDNPRAETPTVRIDYRGTAATAGGLAAVFRVHVEANGPARPSVVATTVDGTLTSEKDYVPFEKTIVFDDDRDVTLAVPIRSAQSSGTLSIILSSPTNATIENGIATALINAPPRRRASRH